MKISIVKKDWYVDPEKKRVVCRMYFRYNPNVVHSDEERATVKKFIAAHKMNDLNGSWNGDFEGSVTGVAKCSENDEFNENLGRHLSETKAQLKYNKIEKSFIDYMSKYYLNKCNEYAEADARNEKSHLYLTELYEKQINDPV